MLSLICFRDVLQGSENPETRKIVYKLSWIGSEGHPGTLFINQGSMVSILPANQPKDSRKANLMVVKFTSFSAKVPVGLMRCQALGEQLEIYPDQLGSRVIRAQMLAAEEEQPTRQSRRQRQAHLRLAAESTSEVAAAKAANNKSNALRRQGDAVHREACKKLQGNEQWLQVVEEKVERKRGDMLMAFQTLQLFEAANCPDFGRETHSTLQAVSFARCLACLKIFTSLSAGGKHRCRPTDQPGQH